MEAYAPSVLEARSVKSRCWQAWFLLEVLQESVPGLSPSFWWVQAILGIAWLSDLSPLTQVMSNSLRPRGLYLARHLCPWDFSGKNTGVSCHFLLPGIFPTQGSNLCLQHGRQIFNPLSHQGSPGVEPHHSTSCLHH